MKKKVTTFLRGIFLLFTVFSFINLNAQTVTNGDFESWTGSNPDGWTCVANFGTNISFAQASGQGVTGDALSVIANAYNVGADGYISTTVTNITPGNYYDLAVMLKTNDDLIKIRMTNLKWKDASDAVISTVLENTLSYNTLGDWIEFKNPQNPLQAPANAVKLEVNIVFYFNVGINPGVSKMLIDNFTVVDKTNAVAALQHAAANTTLTNTPASIVATYLDDIYFSTTIQYPTFLPELPLDVLNDIRIQSNIPINTGTVINIKNTAFSIDYDYNVTSATTNLWITEMLGISRPTLASFSNQTQVWEFTFSGLNGGDYVLTISSVADDNYNTPANYYVLGTDNVTLDIATPSEVAIQDGINNTNMTVLPATQTINSTETATITATESIAEFLPAFPNDLLWDVLISFPGVQLPAGTQMSIELNAVPFATYTFTGGEQELWLTLLDNPNTLDRSPILALNNTTQTITVTLQNIPTENTYTVKFDLIAATESNFGNPANYYYFASGQANVVVDNTIYATFPLFEGFEGAQYYFENAPGNQVNWATNSTLYKEGTKSIHNAYGASNNNILRIIGPININNVDNPTLSFWHIAKTENNYDHCYVEVSTNGTTWTIFPIESYLGQGNYVIPLYNTPEGRCFMTTSYTDWGTTNVPAQNTWWKKEKFSLANYKSETTYIRFRLKSDGSIMYNGWYIDGINLYDETCPDPTGFAATNPLISQVTLNWNPTGTTNNWQIKYSTTSGFNPDTQGTLVDDVGLPPYSLTGLNSSTTYYVYIRTKCGSSDFSPWVGPINFTTLVPCPNPTAFTASNITANSAQLSWTQIDGATQWTIIYGLQGFNPAIDGTALTGVTTNPYTITGLNPQTQYQAYIRANCGVNGNSSLVGPISFTTLASCPVPTSLAFVSATGTTATINWNPVGGTTLWNIQYGPTGFTLGTGTIISGITSLPYTITGLNPTTTYQVYVQADCGSEQSVWSSALSFTTDCNEITPPWLENFSGTFPPSCWLRRQGQLTVNSTLTTSTLWIADGFANVGTTGAARINIYGTNRFAWFITPTINLGDGSNNYMLEFDLALTAYSSTNPPSQTGVDDKFAVVISTDNGATWSSNNILKLWDNQGSPNVYNNISNTGQHIVIDLSSFTGNVKIGFYGESTVANADNDLFIDNVAVNPIPECPAPTGITASNPTINTVDINWTEIFVGTTWDIVYGAPGFNPQNQGTLIEGITTKPYTVTGLTPGTAYHFYIRRNCSGTLSSWVGPASSITLPTCPIPTALSASGTTAYSTNLTWTENGTATEWEFIYGPTGFDPYTSGTLVTGITSIPYTLSGLIPGTVYQAYVRANCGGGDLSPWSTAASFTTECGVFPIIFSQNFSGTFPPLCWNRATGQLANPSVLTTPSTIWVADGFANVGTTGAARINIYSTNRFGWLFTPQIDLGDISEPKLMEFDLALTAYNSTNPANQTGVDDKFAVVISTDGGNTWSSTNVLRMWDNQGSPYVYNNISTTGEHVFIDLTGYSGIVKFGFYGESTISNADNDLFVDNVIVRPLPSCFEPLSVNSGLVTYNSAQISWTELIAGSEWEIAIGAPGFNPNSQGTIISNITTNPYTITGLSPETQYSVYVRTVCGAETSTWTGPANFMTYPSCVAPINLNATAPAGTSITINWTEVGTASQWDLIYGTLGFNPNIEGTLISGISSNSYILTGLTPLTDYTVYVRSDCGMGNYSSWSTALNFNTGCDGAITLPVSESFETGLGIFKNAAGNTVLWQTTNTVASSGTFSAKNPYGANNTNILVTQCPIDLSSAVNPVLQFSNMALTENNYDHCYVEYSTNGTTWTILPVSAYLGTGNYTTPLYNSPEGPAFMEGAYTGWSSATPSNTLWKPEKFSLSEIAGQSQVWIRFRLKSDGSIQRQGWHIDNIQIYNETCPAPSNINIITNSGFQTTIGWNENGTATEWEVLYGPAGFDPQTQGTSAIVNTTQYQITGLTPTTNYQVYVRASCGVGDESIWTGPFSWTTTVACPPVQGTSLVIANYESITIQINTNGDETEWDVLYGLQGFIAGEGTQITVNTNPFTITGLNLETAYDVYVRANCGTNGTSTWVGPFSYSTTELCPPVSNVHTINATPSSVVIGWNPGYSETEWTVEYGLAGFTQGTGTILNLTTNQVELTGLQGNTNYKIYIMANCGGIFGDSDWVQYNFKTPCDVIDVFPWVEEFNNWTAITDCWNLTGGTQTVSQYLGNAVRANFWSWSSGNTAYMTSPDFDISSLNNPRLEFKWSHQYNASYPNDKMEVFVTDNGGQSWTSVWMKTGTAFNSNDGASTTTPGTYVSSGEIYLDAFGDNIKFRIIFTSGFGPDVFIDNITIYDFICEDPSNLSVSNVTHNSAQLSWTDNSGAGWVNIYYGPQGFDPQTEGNVLMNINQNPFTLTGLDAATTYDFYIESLCGTVFSGIIGPVSFTTSDCPEPQNIAASQITHTSATITWTDNSGGNQVNIYFGPTGFNPATEGNVIQNVNPVSYTITGLTANTQYDVYIETICGLSTSTPIGPYSFTTLAYNNETNILTFTFGALDVNPATINPSAKTVYIVVQNGTDLTNLVASFTLSQGATAYVNGVPQVSGVTANNFTTPVIYNVVAENGTDNANWTVTVDVASEISINQSAGIKIYPNPNKGNFIINFTSLEGNVIYQVFDSKSAIITEKSLKDVKNTVEEVKVDVNPGVYYIRIITDVRTFIEKIVIE